MGQLFEGGGKILQGLTIILGPCFQLTEAPYGQVLVPKLVLKCSDSLLVYWFFRNFVQNIGSLTLKGSKKVCGTLSQCSGTTSIFS
jgi:hypothetical protein